MGAVCAAASSCRVLFHGQPQTNPLVWETWVDGKHEPAHFLCWLCPLLVLESWWVADELLAFSEASSLVTLSSSIPISWASSLLEMSINSYITPARVTISGSDCPGMSKSLGSSMCVGEPTGRLCSLLVIFLVPFLGVTTAAAPLFFLPLPGMIGVLEVLQREIYPRTCE